MEKIIEKLKELRTEFNALKKVHHKEGNDKYYQLSQFLERIIDRIYPEKDSKQLKNQLHRGVYFAGQTSDAEEQRDYIYDIDLKLRVIETILQESELFGFKDFKPIKEKIETEAGVKAGIFSLSRKKTTEK